MSEPVLDKDEFDFAVAERPLTVTLHLSPAEVELALMSGGASLRRPAMQALILARVFDVGDLEVAASDFC